MSKPDIHIYEYFKTAPLPAIRAAIRTIASNATDADDLRLLLDIIGVGHDIRR
jgi:hypothetical protein